LRVAPSRSTAALSKGWRGELDIPARAGHNPPSRHRGNGRIARHHQPRSAGIGPGPAFTAFAGEELFLDLVSKVAALIHSLIAFHPFLDGNKRTALVAADVCLRLNGYRLVPSEQIEPFFWSVARGENDVNQIAQWLSTHVQPFADK